MNQEEQDWSTGGESINVAALDQMVKEVAEAWDTHAKLKKVAAEAYEVAAKMEAQIIATLQAANKTKYFVDGVGTTYLINKYIVKTPKDNASKEKFFKYIEDRYGRDVLTSKLSVNHQSLNSFYNEEVVALAKEGRIAEVPGIEQPTHEVSLGLRKG